MPRLLKGTPRKKITTNSSKNKLLHAVERYKLYKLKAFEELLFYGYVNARLRSKRTPLHEAIRLRNSNIVNIVVKLVLTKNADNVNTLGNRLGDGDTSLHMAVGYLLGDIVELLLNKNTNVKARNRFRTTATPLYEALKFKQMKIVKLLLTKIVEVNTADQDGDTPLHIAVCYKLGNIVELLLNKNSDVNARNKSGITPLHEAVKFKQTKILKLLLNKNADVNTADNDGITLLHLAVRSRLEIMVEMMLNKNVDVNVGTKIGITPLHEAVKLKQTNTVKLLLNKNADVNIADSEGITALHLAACCGVNIIVELLLNKNAEVNARNKFGISPLYEAVKRNQVKVVKLLLSKNADVNTADSDGVTPLHLAARSRSEIIAKMLLDKNIDVNARSRYGFTSLHEAAMFGENTHFKMMLDKNLKTFYMNDPEYPIKIQNPFTRQIIHFVELQLKTPRPFHQMASLVELLLNNGADINLRDKDEDTVLHMVTPYGKKDLVQLLLKYGVNVHLHNKYGRTALHLAAEFGLTSVIELLLSAKLDVNAVTQEKYTSLHCAVRSGNKSAVELLLNNGAKINAKDSDGNTPLHIAGRRSKFDIAVLLVSRGADVMLQNNTGDTPLSYTQLFLIHDNQDIIRVLQIAEKDSQKPRDVVQSIEPDTRSNNLHKKCKPNNLKSTDDFGLSGQLYETKMITLFYLRMLNCELLGHDIFLGVNIDDIGDMDDICLRCQVRDQQRPIVLFIQGKHKKSSKSKLTNKDLWSNFDLRKYFNSYLKIKEKFQVNNTDPMLQGKFDDIDCYFILYTPAQECLGTKKKSENKISKIVHDLINTNPNTEPFQYSYDDADIDRIIKAAFEKEFAENQSSVKYYTEEANIFFSRLWFYSNQANESTVESVVKKEINKYSNEQVDVCNVILEQHSDAIFLIVHKYIQEWWKSKNNVPYLTRSNDLFKLAKLICLADVLLIFCNAINSLRIIDVRIQFNNCLHFTTSTLKDLNIILSQLLTAVHSLKLNDIDMDSKTHIKEYSITEKSVKSEITSQINDQSEKVNNLLNVNIISNNNLPTSNEFLYSKRCATSEVGGALFKMKMSSVIFRRALNHDEIDHNTILLKTNIPGISMTDICLRFLLKDQQIPIVLFMQFMYRENSEKGRLTVDELWKDSGNFSLLKYFLSYLEIKERFRKNNEDSIFEGEYRNADCNFFLCTTAEQKLFEKKDNQQINRHILDLINTGENTTVFKFDHDQIIDSLVKVSTESEIDKLGNVFLRFGFLEKYNSDLLSNKLIAKYHVVLAQEVLQPCKEQPSINEYRMWRFRSEFFDSNLEHLNTLKECFFKKLPSKCFNAKKETLQSLNLKLPLAFGNVDMTFRNNDNQTDRIKVVADKLMYLLELNKDSKMIEINDDDVGPGKMLQQGIIDINGGIGSAVGNLLIFDTATKTLKFNLNTKSLPYKANLFLNHMIDNKRYNDIKKDLGIYKIKINIKNFPKSSLYDDENDKRQARDFLNKFWIYPIQVKEDGVERIFKDEINELVSENKIYYKNGNISDLISLFALDRIQKWSLLPNESPYLTRASELFERAELTYIYSLLQSVVNFMYISGTHSIDIKVEQGIKIDEHNKKTEELFKKISSKLINILEPQQCHKPVDWRGLTSYQHYVESKLTLKIHPKMESVQLILTAFSGNRIDYRAFAKACFVFPSSSGEASAKHSFMLYEQEFFGSILHEGNVICD